MKSRFWIAAALVILWSNTSLALPAKIEDKNDVWHVVGEGSLNFLFLDVYDIALYTENGSFNAALPYMLVIEYFHAFSADDIIERSLSEMHLQSPLSRKERAQFKGYLKRSIPDVRNHDMIRAKMIPKQGIEFQVNNEEPIKIADANFAARFLDIWLGKKTSEPELRKKLLHKEKY